MHFVVVATGWNCEGYARACYESIARQEPGRFTSEIVLYDDASTDGTAAELEAAIDGRARLIRSSVNRGAAYSRMAVARRIADPQAVIVLVDMDDTLEPHALRRVAEEYRDPDVWMTFGNWRSAETGRVYAGGFFPPEVIAARRYRRCQKGHATHLRTFRRFLADAVTDDHLRDRRGAWLKVATDRAVLHPMLEQCRARNLRWIDDVVYVHRVLRPQGTIDRYGLEEKKRRIAELRRHRPVPLR